MKWRLLALVVVWAGLCVSALLYVDYRSAFPLICDPRGGCAALKASPFASLLGLPTPLWGILTYTLLGALVLADGPLARRFHVGVAGVMASGGLFFIAVQIALRKFCPYCLVADVSALASLALAVQMARVASEPLLRPWRWLATIGSALALFIPFGWSSAKAATVPIALAADFASAPAGKVTVVEFGDFECPYCRMQHTELAPLLKEYQAKVHFVRKHVPLGIHPHALDAARAGICAESMGKGDELADALFFAPEATLTRKGVVGLAQKHGLDADAFDKCLDDPKTAERIERDRKTHEAIGQGVPKVFIGSKMFVGAQQQATLREALLEQLQGK